jgi:hypothetical protein
LLAEGALDNDPLSERVAVLIDEGIWDKGVAHVLDEAFESRIALLPL